MSDFASYNKCVCDQQVMDRLPLQLKWRRGPDMPFKMGGFVQSVRVQDTVYVGGGDAGINSENNKIIMAYDISTEKWTTLPPYRAIDFGMTTVDNELVLLGGEENNRTSKVLGVWKADANLWAHPYPDMLIARSRCSAAASHEWLVIAGGWSKIWGALSSVEVMNMQNGVQNTGPLTPIKWHSMKTAVLGEEMYVMGGYNGDTNSFFDKVYRMSISALLAQFDTQNPTRQIWKSVPDLKVTRSTPLAIDGSLLALGGRNREHQAVSTISLYQPVSEEWLVVGELPSPRWKCGAIVVGERELLVVGGYDNGGKLRKTDIASVQ